MGNSNQPSDLEIAEAIAAGATEFVNLLLIWYGSDEGYDVDDSRGLDELENLDKSLGFNIECVESTGGYEGGGDYVGRVIKIAGPVMGEQKEIYVSVTGTYSSYEGIEWDSSAEYVYPREVTVIQYFNEQDLKHVSS